MADKNRYVVTIDTYVYAENDYMARKKAHQIIEDLNAESKNAVDPRVIEIGESPMGRLEYREFDDISRPKTKEEKEQKLPF